MGGTSGNKITLQLHVWRQKDQKGQGSFEAHKVNDINTDMSFLEMLDVLNQTLIKAGKDPVAFDHDCREGICGSCAMTINGNPHGPARGTAVCQLHMRKFSDGETVYIEPFRAEAFPIIKDLSCDRSALDKIIAAGGYVSINTGNAPEANSIPIAKVNADAAFSAAECIGCGACVAACANSSAMLFTSAKISHLEHLEQGKVESDRRVLAMVEKMQELGFGNCSNTGACSLSCPKEIDFENIARLNRNFMKAAILERPEKSGLGEG